MPKNAYRISNHSLTAFWATFVNGCKYLWRDKVSVTILTVFPIVIILILGTSLSSYITIESELEPVTVAVAAEPDGPLKDFLQSEEISRFFTLTFTDETAANEMAASGEAAAAIIENRGEISVVCASGVDTPVSIVLSVMDSYRQIGGAATIAAMQGDDFTEKLTAEINIKEMPLGKRIPGAMDYYAVTMLVMILMYTGLNGSELFAKGLLDETGRRTRLSPISKPALVGGMLAASTVTSYLQGMITFVFTAAVYGVYWGERIPLVLTALFAVTLFSQALCIFLVALLGSHSAAGGLSQALIWVMTFVSDGYSKVSFGPADEVFQYTPNAMAHSVIFGAVYGGNEEKMMLFLGLLFGLGGLFFILSFISTRTRLRTA
jgi:ABC-2 type transport system permease protein